MHQVYVIATCSSWPIQEFLDALKARRVAETCRKLTIDLAKGVSDHPITAIIRFLHSPARFLTNW
jgi:hypothetical protein